MFNMANVIKLDSIKNLICSKDKKISIIFILGISGILLILLSNLGNLNKENDKYSKKKDFDIEIYETDLEKRLLNIVEKINGVGKAKIMVTLENSVEYIYAQEERKKTDKMKDYQDQQPSKIQERDDEEQKLMLVDGPNGKKQALIKTQIQPKVKGVVVVCEGGDNESINNKVINLITTILNISPNKVYVTKILN